MIAKELVGPGYISHNYSAFTHEERQRNVDRAALLSSVVNALGIATISPLQECRGRESAMNDDQWLAHGLVLLRCCKCIVLPDYWKKSRGCREEMGLARRLDLRVFIAKTRLDDAYWDLPISLYEWAAGEHARLHEVTL